MDKEQHQVLFLFAAKLGALEGYLFHRRKVEPLANWVDNISQMYHDLSPELKGEIAPAAAQVLERTLKYGDRVLESGLKAKLQQLLVALGKAG